MLGTSQYNVKRLLVPMTGGYKGYGLSMMVDVLTGILSGGSFGPNIRFWKGASRVANLVGTTLQT